MILYKFVCTVPSCQPTTPLLCLNELPKLRFEKCRDMLCCVRHAAAEDQQQPSARRVPKHQPQDRVATLLTEGSNGKKHPGACLHEWLTGLMVTSRSEHRSRCSDHVPEPRQKAGRQRVTQVSLTQRLRRLRLQLSGCDPTGRRTTRSTAKAVMTSGTNHLYMRDIVYSNLYES